MILVTGAAGHFGKAAIEFLLKKDIAPSQIIGMVRDDEKASDLKSKGVQSRIGDYNNYASLVSAFSGVEKLLFISGSEIENRSLQHQNVVNAAKEAGVKHVVYTSFLGKNETESSPLWMVAESHLKTENWLRESGMDYTILKNTLYMDFVPVFMGENVLDVGIIYLPAGSGRVAAALRSEMAEATANILVRDNHVGKVYRFTNSESFSYHEVAQILGDISKKDIKYISPTVEDFSSTLKGFGVPDSIIGLTAGFAIAQAQGELEEVGSDLENLLGRKPTTVKAFLNQIM